MFPKDLNGRTGDAAEIVWDEGEDSMKVVLNGHRQKLFEVEKAVARAQQWIIDHDGGILSDGPPAAIAKDRAQRHHVRYKP